MKVARYILNFCIIFCLASAVWLETVGASIESKERIWGRSWMLITDSPSALVFCAILFFMLRLLIGQPAKKQK
jgi:site-specific recombinase